MLRIVQQLLLTAFFAVFASQASAMFIQPDWFEVTEPGVGTNRYSYSGNDPINRADKNGNLFKEFMGFWGGVADGIYQGPAGLSQPGNVPIGRASEKFGAELDAMLGIGVSIGDGTISGSVSGLGEILGPGDDISNPGAAEPNIERGKPYGEVVEGIQGLPGATVTGEFDTPWGKGKVIELPDGTKISVRPGSKSGGPTVEVTDPDGNTEKNRFPEQEAEEEGEQEGTRDDE